MEDKQHAGFQIACTERIHDSPARQFGLSSLFLQGLKISSEKEFVTNHTDDYLWGPVLILVFNPSL